MRKNIRQPLLYIAVVAALLPVIFLRDFTPANELRYLSIADEALRNHVFFAFTNHGVPYADKPPLYLWIVMLCKWLTGEHRMWLLSLFSLLPALGVVRTMDHWTRDVADCKSRRLADMMLLTCGMFIGMAVTLRMDMLMCLFITLSLREFWILWNDGKGPIRSRWLFPLYMFLALFTKGPLGLLIPLCSTTAFLAVTGRIRLFFKFWGWRTWGVLLACCVLWFGAVYVDGGADYLHNLLFHQTIDRAVDSFHHKEPIYYYAVSIWYTLAPWSLLAVGIFVFALRRKFECSDLVRFFLVVSVTTFLLLSFISSKLQIYLLPATPFIIYTSGLLLPRFHDAKWARVAIGVPSFLFALALPALILIAASGKTSYLGETAFYVAATLLTVGGLCSLYVLFRKGGRCHDAMTKAANNLGTCMLAAVFAGGFGMPGLNAMTGYGTICNEALELSRKYNTSDFRAWHIARPENMDVYLHHGVSIINSDSMPRAGNGKSYLLITRKRDLPYIQAGEVRSAGRFAVAVCR